MNTDSVHSLTIPERVVQFLEMKKPEAFCDDCLANALDLRRAQVSTVTSTLALCREYRRSAETCASCGRGGKFVTSSATQKGGRR